jgi:hypothetical protein
MSKELVVDNSVQASKPLLEGFKIHNVEFKGAEKTDLTGRDSTIYKTVVIKFENENGIHRSTIFEPKEEDYTRKVGQYGPNPCRVDIILDYFKQLVAAVNPTLAKEIADGTTVLKFKNWDELRNAFVNATKDSIGTKVQLKLEKNKKGEAQVPGFPMGIDKEGVLYRSSTYVGANIGWTPKELKAMNNYTQASPTPMRPSLAVGLDLNAPVAAKSSADDLNLPPAGLSDLEM